MWHRCGVRGEVTLNYLDARRLVSGASNLHVSFWLEGLTALVEALDVLTNEIVLHAPGHHVGFHLSIVLS